MEKQKRQRKTVQVALSEEDYKQLTQLARESGRTAPGYLRWLLHRHLREQDRAQEGDG